MRLPEIIVNLAGIDVRHAWIWHDAAMTGKVAAGSLRGFAVAASDGE